MTPRVSICIPAHNAAAYLDEAVASLVAQTIEEWECWIVDDGSSDSTPEIAARWATRDPRIHWQRQPERRGQIATTNHALGQARAPVVKVLHADDRLLPEYLASVLAAFAEDEDCAVVATAYFTIDAQGRRGPQGFATAVPLRLSQREFLWANLLGLNPAWVPSCHAVRREVWERAGGYEAPPGWLRHRDWGFDWYAMWKVAALGGCRVLEAPLVEYRRHPAQVSGHLFGQSETYMRAYWLRRAAAWLPLPEAAWRQIWAAHTVWGLLAARDATLRGDEAAAAFALADLARHDPWWLTYEEGALAADVALWQTGLAQHRADVVGWLGPRMRSAALRHLLDTGLPVNVVAWEVLTLGHQPARLLAAPATLAQAERWGAFHPNVVTVSSATPEEMARVLNQSAHDGVPTVLDVRHWTEGVLAYARAPRPQLWIPWLI